MTAGRSILIVDDNPANTRLLSFVLRSKGFEVTTAEDARQALAALEAAVPDLILMDVQLPGMDGLELTRRVKADPRTAHVVVAAVTAYAMKGDEERALAAGCDAYIAKPIDTRTLPGRITELLAGKTRG